MGGKRNGKHWAITGITGLGKAQASVRGQKNGGGVHGKKTHYKINKKKGKRGKTTGTPAQKVKKWGEKFTTMQEQNKMEEREGAFRWRNGGTDWVPKKKWKGVVH